MSRIAKLRFLVQSNFIDCADAPVIRAEAVRASRRNRSIAAWSLAKSRENLQCDFATELSFFREVHTIPSPPQSSGEMMIATNSVSGVHSHSSL